MRAPRCPDPVELERGFWSDDPAIREHASDCEACSAAWFEIDGLRELASAIDGPPIDRDRAEEIRTALLASAPGAEPGRRWWPAAAAAATAIAAALVIGAIASGDRAAIAVDVPQRRGAVSGSRAVYAVASLQPDEVVRLESGSIEVEVDALGRGERFRVVTADAEVEVRGTRFAVAASAGALERVEVFEGVVVVRVDGVEKALAAGQRWEREREAGTEAGAATATEAATEAGAGAGTETGTAAASAKLIKVPRPEPVAPPGPTLYQQAWDQLRASRYDRAAALFERAAERGRPGFRRDATYWAGVAHFRAGATKPARAWLARFLARFPDARRQAEVSVMLGWIDVDQLRWNAAERRFRAGMASSSAEIRKSAAEGLRAVRRGRGE